MNLTCRVIELQDSKAEVRKERPGNFWASCKGKECMQRYHLISGS